MSFSHKLSGLRKKRGLTQKDLAHKAGIGIAQMRRYEKGHSSPTLMVIKNIAITLGVTTDELIFDEGEMNLDEIIQDHELLEQFREVSKMNPHDKSVIKTVMESMILKHRLDRIMPSRRDNSWSREMQGLVKEFRKGAEDYTDDDIESIVDEAVDAVRKAGR